MEVKLYLQILWQRRYIILLAIVAAVAAAIVATVKTEPAYAATATVRVITVSTGIGSGERYDISYTDRLINTYIEIAKSSPIIDEVAQRLNLGRAPIIEVSHVSGTELLKITAEDSNPAVAADIANTVTHVLIDFSRRSASSGQSAADLLEDQLSVLDEDLADHHAEYATLLAASPRDESAITALNRSIQLQEQLRTSLREQYEEARTAETLRANAMSVVEPARPPLNPSRPRPVLNVSVGALAGLVAGAGIAFLASAMDTRLASTAQIEDVAGVPVIGTIPPSHRRDGNLLASGTAEGEAFRQLRTRVLAALQPSDSSATDGWHSSHNTLRRAPVLIVTSPEPKNGKSTIVANLARSLAEAGRSVLLIDCDMRRPTQHKIFGINNDVGLSDLLRNQDQPLPSILGIQKCGVSVLPSGATPTNPSELLCSNRMHELLRRYGNQYDVILLDTPALLAVADAAILVSLVDAVILVVDHKHADRESVMAACKHLQNAPLLGVVVNRGEPVSEYRAMAGYYERRTQ